MIKPPALRPGDRIAALSPLDVRHEDHTIRVVLAGQKQDTEVVLAEQMSEPLLSMCRASTPGRVRTFTLVSIEATG